MWEIIAKYWLQFLLTVVSGGLVAVVAYVKRVAKQWRVEHSALRDGMVSLLHNILYRNCACYLSRGYITDGELEDLEYTFKSYKELGGNGTGEELYKRAKQLKIKVEQGGNFHENQTCNNCPNSSTGTCSR